jgi:hypothetical protein
MRKPSVAPQQARPKMQAEESRRNPRAVPRAVMKTHSAQ